jgi:hypothetical protein
MINAVISAGGWFASRRAGDEIETMAVLAFIVTADPMLSVTPIVIERDGSISQERSWVLWSDDVTPPEWVIDQLGGDEVEQWSPVRNQSTHERDFFRITEVRTP